MSQNRGKWGLGRLELGDSEQKRAYNRRLFDVVAPAYQQVTSVLSFGQDREWKSRLVSWLPERQRPAVADLACGTGDFLKLLRDRYPRGTIVGMDLNREMMAVGLGMGDGRERAVYVEADLDALPLGDASVDIVTAGYALRNAPRLEVALGEIARVLKPGGVAAVLDFSRPSSTLGTQVELALLGTWGRLWGRYFHRDGEVYGYIARSLAHYPDREALTAAMCTAGLGTVKVARPFLGFLELRLVQKEGGHLVDGAERDRLHGEVGRD